MKKQYYANAMLAVLAALAVLGAPEPTQADHGEVHGKVHGKAKVPNPLCYTPGPVTAKVLRVVDGDSVLVEAYYWLGTKHVVSVRVLGIKAAEPEGETKAEGLRASVRMEKLVSPLSLVQLTDLRYGSFVGRIIGRITTAEGVDVGKVLLGEGLVKSAKIKDKVKVRCPWKLPPHERS